METLKKYTKRVAKKAVKTFAQTLGAVLTADGTGLIDTDWTGALSAAGMAALLAVLMNIGSESTDELVDVDPAPNQD